MGEWIAQSGGSSLPTPGVAELDCVSSAVELWPEVELPRPSSLLPCSLANDCDLGEICASWPFSFYPPVEV